MRRTLLAITVALGLAGTAWAQPASHCTRDTLFIRGEPVTATLCVTSSSRAAGGSELRVGLTETYSAPRGTLSQPVALTFIAGEATSRVIEDLPLERLGMTGTLHLTLGLRGGLVRIENAILTPGAITVK